MFVKVCGLRSETEIDIAYSLGYDGIGIVTTKKSKRYIDPKRSIELANYAKKKYPRVKRFAVALTYDELSAVENYFDYLQIYQEINNDKCVYASSSKPEKLYSNLFIYDSSRGRGVFEKIPHWIKYLSSKVIISGGLTPDNISELIRNHNYCYGVDVSSGVEVNGVKDLQRMKRFIEEVRDVTGKR